MALWISGLATLVIGVVLLALDMRMTDAGGPGIIGFEFAGSEERAAEILADWGDKGRDAARLSLWIDYAYLAAYGTFLTLAVVASRDLAERRRRRRLAAIGTRITAFPIGAVIFDGLEDAWLLLALGGHGGDVAPFAAALFATIKFVLLAVSLLYLLAGLAARLR